MGRNSRKRAIEIIGSGLTKTGGDDRDGARVLKPSPE